jgi:hypothetical protein
VESPADEEEDADEGDDVDEEELEDGVAELLDEAGAAGVLADSLGDEVAGAEELALGAAALSVAALAAWHRRPTRRAVSAR